MSDFRVDPLIEQLEEYSEERVQEVLSSYSCPHNLEIESFLREKAILFSKSALARTYLVYSDQDDFSKIAGFFTLSQKSLLMEGLSDIPKRLQKSLRWFSDSYGKYNFQIASVIMIAQLAKNYSDEANALVTGADLLAIAFSEVLAIQRGLGGKLVCVECEDTMNLINFYEANGFRRLQNRFLPNENGVEGSEYFVQLVRTI